MSVDQFAALREKLNVKSAADASRQVKMLLMGDPGSGKTLLAGTAADIPELCPILYLDVEGGVVTNAKYPEDILQARPIKNIQQMETVWNILDKERGYYKTVIVDSLSELQKLDMAIIMAAAKKRSKTPELIDVEVPSPREYLMSQVHMRDIVREYRDLGLHVIFITHSKTEEKAGKTKILPQVPGQQAAELAGFLSIVGLLEVERLRVKDPKDDKKTITKIVRALTTGSDGISVVKDRTQTLPGKMLNPTMPKIWDYINGKRTKEESE